MSRFKRYERYKDSGVKWIGEIPEEWETVPLKRIFKIINGGTPSSSEESYWNGEIVWVTPNDLSKLTEACIVDSERKITEDGLHNCSARIVPKGSIVISTRAPIGYVAIAEVPLCTNQGCKSLVPTKVINNKYFYYWMHSISFYLNVLGQGTTFLELSNSSLSVVELLTPSINEQKAIANFLDQKTAEIDGLIADKEKLIELLQEKRQAIITEAVTKGLNPNVRMKDSGIEWIGEIPEHWEVKRIKYLATVNPSKSEVRHLPPEQEVTFIPMEKIVATGKVDYSITNTVENLIDGYTYFRDGDIIMAKVTPCFENGNIAIVNGLLNGIGFGTTELHVLRCNNKCFNKFLFYYLQSDVFKSKGVSEMYGVAGLKRIPTDFILNYKLGIPDYLEQEQIANYLDEKTSQIDELVSNIQLQIQKLKEYRQSLISEAVTGKIDVRDYVVSN
jgi:type I restriction enzyme S subunit